MFFIQIADQIDRIDLRELIRPVADGYDSAYMDFPFFQSQPDSFSLFYILSVIQMTDFLPFSFCFRRLFSEYRICVRLLQTTKVQHPGMGRGYCHFTK